MVDARVLVADDDDDLRSLVCEALVEVGAQVVEADSGVALLQKLGEEGPFDLVITDVRMSWASGVQALAMARLAGCDTPFIVITAYDDADLRVAVEAQGTPLLRKPFDVERLLDLARQRVRRDRHAAVAAPHHSHAPAVQHPRLHASAAVDLPEAPGEAFDLREEG